MESRKKLTISFVIFLVISIGSIFGALKIFVFSEFERLERDDARYGLTSGLAAIRGENASLLAWVKDVGPWNDTYDFAETGNPAYIASNYDPQAIGNLDFDLILFADNGGSVLWSYVSGRKTIRDLHYEQFLQFINESPEWETSTGVAGLFRMSDSSVYLVAAHPIQTSEYRGPSRGSVVFGRRLDNARFENLIQSSVADFDLQIIDGNTITNEIAESIANNKNGVDTRRENGITKAYAILNDVNRQPAILLEIRAHVATTRKGAESIRNVMYSYILISVLGLAIFLLISVRSREN